MTARNIVPLNARDKAPEKPLPHNIDAEQAVLGGILMNNAAYAKIADFLEPTDFYEAVHGEIYDCCRSYITEGRIASPITLQSAVGEMDLGKDQTGREISSKEYIARLAAQSVSISETIEYAKLLKDCSLRRTLFTKFEEWQTRILDDKPKDHAGALVAEIESEMVDVRLPTGEAKQEFEHFGLAADRAVEVAYRAYEHSGVLAGLSTGLDKLDEICGGLAPTDFIVLAGRPGMGKSALAVNIGYNVAREIKRLRDEEKNSNAGVVGIFSLEMSSDQLAQRVLAEHSRVSGWRLRKGKVSEGEITAFGESARVLRDLPIQIDQTGGIPLASLVMRARRLHKRRGLKLLIIDYLQLITVPKGKQRDQSRVDVVTEITSTLKALAKELKIPVIALSQLSRKVEERDDKRPMLSDLRESGSIEQDADSVFFVYREHYYLTNAKPTRGGPEELAKWEEQIERTYRMGEVIVSKNRHGPAGTVVLGWDPDLTQFNNDIPEYIPKPKEDRPKKEEKPKPLRLPPQAAIAHAVLRSLSISHSIENDGQIDAAPKDAKLVLYAQWRAKCAEDILVENAKDEKKVTAMMEKCFIALKAPGEGHPAMVGRGLLKDQIYVWLLGKTK